MSKDNAGASVKLRLTEVKRNLLQQLFDRYYGRDPEIDARIDAAAPMVMGEGAAPKYYPSPAGDMLPFFIEGAAGIGKTAIIEQVVREFCTIAGLNFVPASAIKPGYTPGEKDYLFVTSNMIGDTNKLEFGGLPVREAIEIGNKTAPNFLEKAKSWMEFGQEAYNITGDIREFGTSNYQAIEIELKTSEATERYSQAFANKLGAAWSDSGKKSGFAVNRIPAGEEPRSDRLSWSVDERPGKTVITLYQPPEAERKQIFVAKKVPDIRYEMGRRAWGVTVFFDEVDKIPQSIRNVLLEVAQKGRVSGTLDLGDNANVIMAGNTGGALNKSMSEHTPASATRSRMIEMFLTPKEWAEYITEQYSTAGTGDCHMASFMASQGSSALGTGKDQGTSTVFQTSDDDAYRLLKSGSPVANPRAWENALRTVYPFFMDSRNGGRPIKEHMPVINQVISQCVGRHRAQLYASFVTAMESDAVPMARKAITTGKLDEEAFNAKAGGGNTSEQKDFVFRFSMALADSAIERIVASGNYDPAKAEGKKILRDAMVSYFDTLGFLNGSADDALALSVSRLRGRMIGLEGFFRAGTDGMKVPVNGVDVVIGDALRETVEAKGAWSEDPDKRMSALTTVTAAFMQTSQGAKAIKEMVKKKAKV